MGDVGSALLGFTFARLPLLVTPERNALTAILVVWPFVSTAPSAGKRYPVHTDPISISDWSSPAGRTVSLRRFTAVLRRPVVASLSSASGSMDRATSRSARLFDARVCLWAHIVRNESSGRSPQSDARVAVPRRRRIQALPHRVRRPPSCFLAYRATVGFERTGQS